MGNTLQSLWSGGHVPQNKVHILTVHVDDIQVVTVVPLLSSTNQVAKAGYVRRIRLKTHLGDCAITCFKDLVPLEGHGVKNPTVEANGEYDLTLYLRLEYEYGHVNYISPKM